MPLRGALEKPSLTPALLPLVCVADIVKTPHRVMVVSGVRVCMSGASFDRRLAEGATHAMCTPQLLFACMACSQYVRLVPIGHLGWLAERCVRVVSLALSSSS